MELNGWTSPQMLRRHGASVLSTRARRSYDPIVDPIPLTCETTPRSLLLRAPETT